MKRSCFLQEMERKMCFLEFLCQNNEQFSANFSEMGFWDFFKEFSLEDTTCGGLFGSYLGLSRSVIRWGSRIFKISQFKNVIIFSPWTALLQRRAFANAWEFELQIWSIYSPDDPVFGYIKFIKTAAIEPEIELKTSRREQSVQYFGKVQYFGHTGNAFFRKMFVMK